MSDFYIAAGELSKNEREMFETIKALKMKCHRYELALHEIKNRYHYPDLAFQVSDQALKNGPTVEGDK